MRMRWMPLLLLLFLSQLAIAQIENPVSWRTEREALGDGVFLLTWTAEIEAGWSIYSQFTGDGGPVPTTFYFDEGNHYRRIGEVAEEGKKKEGFDELFGTDVIKFVGSPVVFSQKVKISDFDQPITGAVEFMVCNDEQCLPPTDEPFSFQLEAQGTDETTAALSSAPEAAPQVEATPAKALENKDIAAKGGDKLPALPEGVVEIKETKPEKGLLDPIDWRLRIRSAGPNRYQLAFSADIESGWTLYSKDNDPDSGPIPTSIYFDTEGVQASDLTETGGKRKSGMDDLFGVQVVKYLSGPVTFSLDLEVPDGLETLEGYVEYMTCDDRQCIPGDLPFRIQLDPMSGALGLLTPVSDPFLKLAPELDTKVGAVGLPSINNDPLGNCQLPESSVQAGSGLLTIFGLGFLGGLLALLTPCVFPMIPLTVSFFTKGSDNRKKGIQQAAWYGFFILLVYLLLSIPFHLIDVSSDVLNELSTNVYLNIFFFLVFIFFAFSFFGYYELTVPERWSNRSSQAEGVGGLVGIFFMALTLALVSFSCTGPILGSLLVGALTADGGAMQLTAGMGGFGLALALPFTLFAIFPQFMKALPKSGGWMNSVKVVLGFVELALAFKFLSNADLVKHWGLLRIEPFLIIWILCGLGIALYLFGVIRFPHDSPMQKRSPVRIALAGISLAFVLYLLSGFLPDERSGSYRPLGLLSGIAPPVCYSYFQSCDCPQNLDCFKDLETGLSYAREVNKPVMIDFTGYACVNCRKMEEHVWPEPEVYPILKDDFVLISLYVDDKETLPANEQITVPRTGGGERKLRDKGDRWAHFQAETFKVNTQPYYVLMSPDGQVLNKPVSYTPEPEEYREFLQCGLSNYKQLTEQGKESFQTGQQLGSLK